jgi:hypothetical protein
MVPRKTAHGLVTWEDLTIDDGRVLTGTYGYSDRYVTVKTVHGSKITQRGRESLARIMLR